MRYISFKPGCGPIKHGSAPSFLEAAARIDGMPPVLLGLSIDASRLMQALKTPDDIGAVIRVHKDLDRELRRIVRVMVPKSGWAKLRSMTERIACLKAAGLRDAQLGSHQVRRRVTLRNCAAPRWDRCLSPSAPHGPEAGWQLRGHQRTN